MKFTYTKDDLTTIDADIVAVTCFTANDGEGEKKPATLSRGDGGLLLDKKLGGALTRILKEEDFRAEPGSFRLVPAGNATKYVVMLGGGDPKKFSLDTTRRLGAALVKAANLVRAKSAAGVVQAGAIRGFKPADRAKALAEGIVLGTYKFEQYKAKHKRGPASLETMTLVVGCDRAVVENEVGEGCLIAEATNFARDLVNLPGNVCTPQYLANHAKEIARTLRLDCTILDHKEIVANRMNLLNAVSQGSLNPPVFIHLRYNPPKKAKAHVAIVGKGVTFDTGGVDLKTASGMEDMKIDMAGAASVLAAIKVAATRKIPVIVDAFLPCTENVVDGKSHRPGDIVTSRNGKTVEIVNTDAEGRLVLADAIDYALEKKPDVLIDLATLTGGVFYAVGEIYSAVLGNDQNLINKLIAASKIAGEPMWQLPLEQEYMKGYTSGPADLRNTGKTKASTISGSLFLSAFVGSHKWAHLDIAAAAWTDEARPYTPKGATGSPVRTLCEFLLHY